MDEQLPHPEKIRVSTSRQVYLMICLSHSLSAWGDRMWDFAVGLYMIILFPDSLLLTAIQGFVVSLAVITFGSPVGSWIDKSHRITAASISIAVQNVACAIGGVILALTFAFREDIQAVWNGNLETVIFAVVIFLSVIAKLGSVASDIAIERDWIVVLTEGDENSLTSMNSLMRTIDLTTKILAPVAIGGLISLWSNVAAAIFISAWNVVSGFVEVYLLILIHKNAPQLALKALYSTSSANKKNNVLKECWGGWRQYFRHPVKYAGLGFACLFMTVLGFDQITNGYMYSQGVGEGLVGIITACGAITGIIGSVSYPFLRRCFGKNGTALLGYGLNTTFLLLCAVSVFMPDSPFEPGAILNPFGISLNTNSTSTNASTTKHSLSELWDHHQNIFYFVAGIVFSRFGLWVADLSVAQLFQDKVEESQRGVINGVQNAMNQAMDLFKFILVIVLPSFQTFGYLTFLTLVFGIIGFALHSIYTLQLKQEAQGRHLRTDDQSLEREFPRRTSPEDNERTPLLLS